MRRSRPGFAGREEFHTSIAPANSDLVGRFRRKGLQHQVVTEHARQRSMRLLVENPDLGNIDSNTFIEWHVIHEATEGGITEGTVSGGVQNVAVPVHINRGGDGMLARILCEQRIKLFQGERRLVVSQQGRHAELLYIFFGDTNDGAEVSRIHSRQASQDLARESGLEDRGQGLEHHDETLKCYGKDNARPSSDALTIPHY